MVLFVHVVLDYLTMTSKIHDERYFLAVLGLDNGCEFIEMPGRYGWLTRLYYRGVSVYFGGSRDDVCLEVSGTGCRTVEEISGNTFDWFKFFSDFEFDIRNRDVNISRLDIAGDDREDELLNFSRLVSHCKSHKYICKAHWRIWIDGDEQAIYFGSPSSDRRLRIYNKAIEQNLNDEHWIRVEFQMRDKNALSFLLNWLNVGDIGKCYSGVLRDFLRFTTSVPENNNHQRCKICSWWERFLVFVYQCPQLYIDGGVFTLWHVQQFVTKQAGSSLKLWLEANNGDLTDIISMIEGATLNHRQQELLDRIKNSEL